MGGHERADGGIGTVTAGLRRANRAETVRYGAIPCPGPACWAYGMGFAILSFNQGRSRAGHGPVMRPADTGRGRGIHGITPRNYCRKKP